MIISHPYDAVAACRVRHLENVEEILLNGVPEASRPTVCCTRCNVNKELKGRIGSSAPTCKRGIE